MMEQGLAAQQGGQPQMGQPQGGDMEAILQQVVQLLMQGIDPEELLEQGVPMEIIKQAVQIVMAQQQQQQQSQAPASTEAGLAMSAGM